jgi:hypothetical protein
MSFPFCVHPLEESQPTADLLQLFLIFLPNRLPTVKTRRPELAGSKHALRKTPPI